MAPFPMAPFIDARIPVLFGVAPMAGDTTLAPAASWAGAHAPGCTCCVARSPAAVALDRLFLDRVRGAVPWFARVVVPVAGEAAVRDALAGDPTVSARFRLG